MTTRNWNASAGDFFIPANWNPAGAPQPGDTVIIASGTATVNSASLQGLSIQLNGTSSAAGTLSLVGSSIAANTRVAASSSGSALTPPVNLNFTGNTTNSGIVTFSSNSSGRFAVNVLDNGSGTGGLLDNEGSFDSVGSTVSWSFQLGQAAGTLLNNGMISIWNPSNPFQASLIQTSLTGGGVLQLNPHTTTGVAAAVGSSQMVDFTGGAGAGIVFEIPQPAGFSGIINGFAVGDTIHIQGNPFDQIVYSNDFANGGYLHLLNAGTEIGKLRFNGSYQTSDFTTSASTSGSKDITTSASPSQFFSFTNTVLGLSSTDTGVAYTGAVAGLQRQYVWTSPDSVNISANAPNVFIKGGTGNDTLTASSGSNVLAGGGGADTFVLDGRSGAAAWDTLQDFQPGDTAIIYGFQQGKSTIPAQFTNQNVDGPSGLTGVTIHSELNGQGTGVNASVTFSGIDPTTANTQLTRTFGTLSDGTPYLSVHYGQAPITANTIGVYRFFDTKFGTHFFTASASEKNGLMDRTASTYRPDLVEETNGFGAIDPAASDPNEVSVFRFFDTKFGTHFFTASVSEKNSLVDPNSPAYRPDLLLEPNSSFLEHSAQQAGDIGVYRFLDTVHGTHFYTGDQNEYNAITTPGTATYRADLVSEGISFYAPIGNFT